MKNYKVWYSKKYKGFLDKVKTDSFEPLSLTEYALVKELKAEDMEAVYYNMQGEIWSPNGEARDHIRAIGTDHTSMSIGDLVECDFHFFQVEAFGFKEVRVK